MNVREIKSVLKKAGIHCSTNVYPGEPTSGFHYVCVDVGRGNDAIEVLKKAGADVMRVPACSHIYADNIQVRR